MIDFDRRLPSVALHDGDDHAEHADDDDNDNVVTLQLMNEEPLLLLVKQIAMHTRLNVVLCRIHPLDDRLRRSLCMFCSKARCDVGVICIPSLFALVIDVFEVVSRVCVCELFMFVCLSKFLLSVVCVGCVASLLFRFGIIVKSTIR